MKFTLTVTCLLVAVGTQLVAAQRFSQEQQRQDFDRDYDADQVSQDRDAGVAPVVRRPIQPPPPPPRREEGGRKTAPARKQPEQNTGGGKDYDDGSADAEPPIYGGVMGTPGVDFPNYALIPKTDFKCSDAPQDGMYADMETQCQVYHLCSENRKYDFMCGTGTVFNQAILGCDYWHSVDCAQSPNFYGANAGFGIGGVPEPSAGDSRRVAPVARPAPATRPAARQPPARQPSSGGRLPAQQPSKTRFPQEEDVEDFDRVSIPERPLSPPPQASRPATRPVSTPRAPPAFSAPAPPQRTPARTGKTAPQQRVPARGSGFPASPAKGGTAARLTQSSRRSGLPPQQQQFAEQAKGDFSASATSPVGISRLSSYPATYPRPAASRPRVSWHDFPLPVDRS